MDRQTIENVVKACNVDTSEGPVNARIQQVLVRLVTDLFQAIEDLDLSQSEVWKGIETIIDIAKADEFALMGSAVGLEHFLDLRADEADVKAGLAGGFKVACVGDAAKALAGDFNLKSFNELLNVTAALAIFAESDT